MVRCRRRPLAYRASCLYSILSCWYCSLLTGSRKSTEGIAYTSRSQLGTTDNFSFLRSIWNSSNRPDLWTERFFDPYPYLLSPQRKEWSAESIESKLVYQLDELRMKFLIQETILSVTASHRGWKRSYSPKQRRVGTGNQTN